MKYRNIISVNLLLLILFSSIGFNIISTICDGCDIAQTSIAITNYEQDLSCKCCSVDAHEMSCCKKESNHKDKHHHSTSTFAKLKFDSPEAKAKTFVVKVPVLLLHYVTIVNYFDVAATKPLFCSTIDILPPLAGRTLLTLISILKN